MRSVRELQAIEQELSDKIWYNRKLNMLDNIMRRREKMPPEDIMDDMTAGMRECEEKYGVNNLIFDDFEWGMINGKLSAIRWVLGEEWDMLDT